MKRKVADPLRHYANGLWREDPETAAMLHEMADRMDADHDVRMRSCRHDVMRKAMKDVRYCCNRLERKRNRRRLMDEVERRGA